MCAAIYALYNDSYTNDITINLYTRETPTKRCSNFNFLEKKSLKLELIHS